MKPINSNGQTFEEWKVACDVICAITCGMKCDDLPDWDYWDCWECDHSPKETVAEMLKEHGYDY